MAGGIFGARAPQALVGLAAFDRRGSPAPAALRARPDGPVTTFTWDPPVQAPVGGYVLEAGLQPGQVAAVLPLGAVLFSTVVPPGTFYVRVRTAGAAGGREEVSNGSGHRWLRGAASTAKRAECLPRRRVARPRRFLVARAGRAGGVVRVRRGLGAGARRFRPHAPGPSTGLAYASAIRGHLLRARPCQRMRQQRIRRNCG
ncbi:MAG: hypothetical protein U0P30_11740 [Vicinamibacterales bacterium]